MAWTASRCTDPSTIISCPVSVSSTSWAVRSASSTTHLLRDKGVAVHILNMGLLDNSPMGRLVATMLLAFAEFERAQIIERTQSGRQAARSKPGFRDGRPQKFTALQVEHALGLLSEYSYKQVEAMTGISRSTLQRAKKKVEVQQ